MRPCRTGWIRARTQAGLPWDGGESEGAHAPSFHYISYNLARSHQPLKNWTPELGEQVTPAMAAGAADDPWRLTQIASGCSTEGRSAA